MGGGLVIESFVCEEEDFELYAVCDGEPVQVLEDGVMLSLERVWVSRRAAEFWMY